MAGDGAAQAPKWQLACGLSPFNADQDGIEGGLTAAYSETVLGAGVKSGAGTVETGVGTAERWAEKAG